MGKVAKQIEARKVNVKQKLSEYLKRSKAVARPPAITIKRVNEITRGWINYFRIGMMKQFMNDFGQWLRHKIRVIVLKQWKTPKSIYRNPSYRNRKYGCGFDQISWNISCRAVYETRTYGSTRGR